jgi:hypothetical protein
MKSRLSLSLLVVVLTSLSGLHAAVAAEDPEELIQQGVKLRRKGDNARAEGYFLRAYQLAATPRSAAQLGLAELSLNEFLEAEAHLSEALGKRDAWVSEHRRSIEDGRDEARKHLVRVELAPLPTDTTISNAGAAPVAAPGDGVVFLAPAKPTSLRLEAPGRKGTTVQIVAGKEGETRKVSVDMPALPAPAAPAPAPVAQPSEPAATSPAPAATAEPTAPMAVQTSSPEAQPASPGHGLRVAGIVVASVGVAAGVAGGVFFAMASSKKSSLQTEVNTGNVTTDAFNSRNSEWQSKRTLGIACAAGGGAAIVTGAILYAVGRSAHAEEAPKVSFVPGPGFGILSFAGSF